MKRCFLYAIILILVPVFSCTKEGGIAEASTGEIVLQVADDSMPVVVETKTTAVTSMPSSLYWGGTTGSGASQTSKWASVSASVSSSKINTGKYQTASPTTYNYYVSNVNMSIGANTTVSATGGTSGTDVICGYTEGTNSTTPSITLNHVFARTGSLTTTTSAGSLSSISYTIIKKGDGTGSSGTYNLRTGAWSSVSGLTSATAITGSSDMYLIPGTYTIAVTATYTRGDYVVTTTKYGDVTLTGGKINNMTLTWPTAGTEIVITCSLTAWSSQSVAATLS